ncbi:MAG: hypothetical protein ACJ8AO_10775 [Gemmatimonadaceae bacterium]
MRRLAKVAALAAALAASLALAACKAKSTRGENDSIRATTGAAPDSGPAPAAGPVSTPSIGTSGAAASDTQPVATDAVKKDSAGTKRP